MATIEEYLDIAIKDNLRRTAHHEAGHVVVAAEQGVPLRPEGICVDPIGEGLACYWKEPQDTDSSRMNVIISTFAGFDAEEEFCKRRALPILSGIPLIWSPDWREARSVIIRLSNTPPTMTAIMMEERLHDDSRTIVKRLWSTIEAVANALLPKDWEPLRALK